MEVLNIKGIIHPVIDPKSLFCPLTFWAMAVSTAIVTYPLFTAGIAKIYVSAQSRCTTLLQGIESSNNKTIRLTIINILLSKPIYDLVNFKLRALHYF
jgi:hypothetical protein